jgi:hypothetical protein
MLILVYRKLYNSHMGRGRKLREREREGGKRKAALTLSVPAVFKL